MESSVTVLSQDATVGPTKTNIDQPPACNQNITISDNYTYVQMDSNSSSYHQNSTEVKELPQNTNVEQLKSTIKLIKFSDEMTIAGNNNNEDFVLESPLHAETLNKVQIYSNGSSCHQNSTEGLKELPLNTNLEKLKSTIKVIKFSDEISFADNNNKGQSVVESPLHAKTLTEVQMGSNSSPCHQNSTEVLKELHSSANVEHLKSTIKLIKFSDEMTIAGNNNNEDFVLESPLHAETLNKVQIYSNGSSCHQNSTEGLKELPLNTNVEQLKSTIKEIKFSDEITFADNNNKEQSVVESPLHAKTLTEVQMGSNSSPCHQNSTEVLKELHSSANVEHLKSTIKLIKFSDEMTITGNNNNNEDFVLESNLHAETLNKVQIYSNGSSFHQNSTEGLKELPQNTNVEQLKSTIKLIKFSDEMTIAGNNNNEDFVLESPLHAETLNKVQIYSNGSSCHQNSTEGLKELPLNTNLEQLKSTIKVIKFSDEITFADNNNKEQSVVESPLHAKTLTEVQIGSNSSPCHQNSTEVLKELPSSANVEQLKSTIKLIKFSDEMTIAGNNNNKNFVLESPLHAETLNKVQIYSNGSSCHQNSTEGLKELPLNTKVEQLKSTIKEIKFSDEITFADNNNKEQSVVESPLHAKTLTEVQIGSNSSPCHQNSTEVLKELPSSANVEQLKSTIKVIKFSDEITFADNNNKEQSVVESPLHAKRLTEVQIGSNSSPCYQNSTEVLKELPSSANVEQLKSTIKLIKFSDEMTIAGNNNNEDFVLESPLHAETLNKVQIYSNSSSCHQNSTEGLKELPLNTNVEQLKSTIKVIKFSDEITFADNNNKEQSVVESPLHAKTLTEVQTGSNSSPCHQNSTEVLKELPSSANVEQLKSTIKLIKFSDEMTIAVQIYSNGSSCHQNSTEGLKELPLNTNVEQLKSTIKVIKFSDEITFANNNNKEKSVVESPLHAKTLTEVQMGSNSSPCHQNSTEVLKELPSSANVEQLKSNIKDVDFSDEITIKDNNNKENSSVEMENHITTETLIEVQMGLKNFSNHQNSIEELKELPSSTNDKQLESNIKVILGDEITIADSVNSGDSAMKSPLPTEKLIGELHNGQDDLVSALGSELCGQKTQPVVENIESTQFKRFDSNDNISKVQFKNNQTKSILKRKRIVEENEEPPAKKRKGITFDSVTIFDFPRVQGFTSIPTQGGCTLGMEAHHSDKKTFSVAEHVLEQKRKRREFIQKRLSHKNGKKTICNDESNFKDTACKGTDSNKVNVLQPVRIPQRKALLRAAGVRRIDSAEYDECRKIRTSRMLCGCGCKENCNPDTCSCSQAGIECQVDRFNFPCKCSKENCRNSSGRIEFSPERVRIHFKRTLMRINLKKEEDWMERLDGREKEEDWMDRLDGRDVTSVLQQNQSFSSCLINKYF
ncbi:unnamed protein product [Diabrotica balteata]|uniref:Cysteine/serine-rich nuclear protein N-terminal domain-containing protein n=1 Tax=Diabrotica balteata TaxID=107213 RepID=A0A9N9SUM6_DIABA|nr:unnamed protein product [Diabrotica balteata]